MDAADHRVGNQCHSNGTRHYKLYGLPRILKEGSRKAPLFVVFATDLFIGI